MQTYFNQLADTIQGLLTGEEIYTASFGGEDSDFVRFNKALVRQAGVVRQGRLLLDLIVGQRHASSRYSLSGTLDQDVSRGLALLDTLRETIPHLPDDPHLLYSTDVQSTERVVAAAGIMSELLE